MEAIRGAVQAVDEALQGLGMQQEVLHEPYLADADATGGQEYGEPVPRMALVQRKDGLLRTAAGQDIRYRAIVSFLRPVQIGPRDRITLSDGTTGPIVSPHGGLLDSSTDAPFLHLVHIGAS